jgi:serine/threonine protein kinase
MLEGIKVMHQNNIIHRDLKPDNILLLTMDTDLLALIGDFGFCRILGDDKMA